MDFRSGFSLVRALPRLSTENWANAFPRKRRPSWMAAMTAAGSGSSFSVSSSRAATRGAAASKVKFWSRDSFLSASRASLPSSPFMMLFILGQRVSSPSGKPNLSSHDLLVALSTGFGRRKLVSRKAFVAEDTSKVLWPSCPVPLLCLPPHPQRESGHL